MSRSRSLRFLVLLVVFLGFSTSLFAIKMGDCEVRDPESGTLMCGRICMAAQTGSRCILPQEPNSGYCWQATLINPPPSASESCHQGDWDPCCDTGGGF